MRWAFYVRSVPFAQGHITGERSLGGSESACVGLAQALSRRGHRVVVFVHDLADDCHGWTDANGVTWEPSIACRRDYLHHTWDVFTGLRMLDPFLGDHAPGRFRILWNQDLLQDYPRGQVANLVSGCWSVDRIAYVSEYHRHQWEGLAPDLTRLGWVTRNGYNPAIVPQDVHKHWRRVIHISRPERGLGPLLAMWPALKALVPEAELRLCRYQSMYDGEGTACRITCEQYDHAVALLNAEVGGITWLGSLGKEALYREIAEAAVMWYPGIAQFAETSCIAAIEAQACGTPLVLSAKGALPETAPSATFIEGDATTPQYQEASVAAVAAWLEACRDQRRVYRTTTVAGRAHVDPAYTYDAIAEQWEDETADALVHRATSAPTRVLDALLAVDDHVAAAHWLPMVPDGPAKDAARTRIATVIAGEDQTADDYATFANAHPDIEAATEPRFHEVSPAFAGATRLLDVACGNGAAALRFAQDHPGLTIVGVDYAAANIARATAAAAELGLSDRVTFHACPVYDYGRQRADDAFVAWLATHAPFDAVFIGEFLEHCVNTASLVDAIETGCALGARVVATMPHGPFIDLLTRTQPIRRGHVHHFEIEDLDEVFGGKSDLRVRYLHHGLTPKGDLVGTWIVSWVPNGTPTGTRDLARVGWATRPYVRLSVGLIVCNEASNIRRCLESVYAIADEIVIGDTGSTDETLDLVRAYDTRGKVRILHLPPVASLPEGFADARNMVLQACTGDWFLWIDADETLSGATAVKARLEAGPFVGYAVQQIHLMADDRTSPPDLPVRLFQRRPGVRFYGAVHEQPQAGDANTDIMPARQVQEFAILHFGYPVADARRVKSNRNLPLLTRNHTACPERALNAPLDLRELVLRAEPEALRDPTVRAYVASCVEAYGYPVRPVADARELLLRIAVHVAEQAGIPDPRNKYHQVAVRWYEAALAGLGEGWSYEFAFAGTQGDLNGRRAQPRTILVRTAAQIAAHLTYQAEQAAQGMALVVPDTTPIVRTEVPV